MRSSRRFAFVIVLAGVQAAAADGLDGERFSPSVGVEGTIAIEHPSVAEHKDWGIGLFFHFAQDQIVVRDGDDVTQNVLEKAITAELVGSFGLFGKLELGFGLPFHFVYEGNGFAGGGALLAPTDGVGDLRLVPKLALIQSLKPKRRLLLSLGVPLTLATGDDEAARGAGGFTAMPVLMFGYHRTRGFGFGFSLGYKYRSVHPANLPYGDAVVVQPWIAYLATSSVTLRLEVLAEKQIDAAVDGADFPVELVPGLDFRVKSVDLFLGGGFGLTDGVGSPAFRVIGGIRYRYFRDGGKTIAAKPAKSSKQDRRAALTQGGR
jgi:hypothetical protein